MQHKASSPSFNSMDEVLKMTKHTQTTAARTTASELQTLARQGVERALAARRTMTELSPEQTQHVSGAASFATSYGSLVPGWWIYGQPAFQLSQAVISQGLNQVPGIQTGALTNVAKFG
jgi:hypothetical protein